jgi:hypothetical protein
VEILLLVKYDMEELELARLLGAPAFQPASPDAGSMPASGDRAARATWYVSFRMFSSDGFGSGLKGFRDFLRLWHGIEPRQSRAGWKAGDPSEPRQRLKKGHTKKAKLGVLFHLFRCPFSPFSPLFHPCPFSPVFHPRCSFSPRDSKP